MNKDYSLARIKSSAEYVSAVLRENTKHEGVTAMNNDLQPCRNCKLEGKFTPCLRWTKENPTKEGWYWYRKDSSSVANNIVRVSWSQEKNCLVGNVWLSQFDVKEFGGEWAGPIEEPLS